MFAYRINVDELIRLLKEGNERFLKLVRDKWQKTGQYQISDIVKDELTVRPGLNRISGNAARALYPVTEIKNGNVYHRWVAGGPAAKYLPLHQYGGVIKAKGAGYLRFKITTKVASSSLKSKKTKTSKVYDWIMVKQVTIPKRLHIIERFTAPGNELREQDVIEAMKEITNP